MDQSMDRWTKRVEGGGGGLYNCGVEWTNQWTNGPMDQWTNGPNGVKWTRVPTPRPAAAGEGTAVMKHRRATGASLLPKTLPAVGSPPTKVVHLSITHSSFGWCIHST